MTAAMPATSMRRNGVLRLPPVPATPAAFAPFGDLILPSGYGTPFGPGDAALDLSRGRPRLSIMRVPDHGLAFDKMARHRAVTQCLGAATGKRWYLVVAPPEALDDPEAVPAPDALQAFVIEGSAVVKLHRGTWHAGPYFQASYMDFFNLELADTNRSDHQAADLRARHGLRIEIAVP